MIKLTMNDTAITLTTHEVEGKQLYKAQDLLKGYGMEGRQVGDTVRHFKDSMEQKGIREIGVSVKGGKNQGTYLTKRNLLKLAGYVSYEFEDAVYEAFELLAEGNVVQAESVAVGALQVAISKAIQNNREGKLVGKQVSKALRECVGAPLAMVDVLAQISKGMSTLATGKGREGYWQQARVMVQKLSDEYRMTTKAFDLGIHGQYEQVMHYCTKRIAQVRK